MRNMKLIIALALLFVGSAVLIRWSANDPSVRGQDANIETRATNTAGAPLVGTSGPADSTVPSTAGPDGRSGPAAAGAGVWRGDGGFVGEAAEMNATETALADLAQRNATDAGVKAYAAELHRDHGTAGQELKTLASRKQWAYPQSLDALQAQALQGLQRAQGPEFDRAFVDAMIAAHERGIRAFTAASTSSADPELKAFAAKQLPVLQRHLDQAKNLR